MKTYKSQFKDFERLIYARLKKWALQDGQPFRYLNLEELAQDGANAALSAWHEGHSEASAEYLGAKFALAKGLGYHLRYDLNTKVNTARRAIDEIIGKPIVSAGPGFDEWEGRWLQIRLREGLEKVFIQLSLSWPDFEGFMNYAIKLEGEAASQRESFGDPPKAFDDFCFACDALSFGQSLPLSLQSNYYTF